MDFGYSEDQMLARATVVRFAESLNHSSAQCDTDEFPWETWRAAAEHGLLGLTISDEFGGGGLDCETAAIVLEAFGYGCHDHGLVHAACTQNLCAIHIDKYGTNEQKDRLLRGICSGELVAAQAITEPDAGSDFSAIKTKAEKYGNNYVLNGSKVFITNGPIADVIIVYAVSNAARKVMGRASCFIVQDGTVGLSKGKALEKMGLNSLQNGELFFSDCEIPADALLGREGSASNMFAEGMNWERVLLFATFVGKMERVIEQSVEYARTRKQFGETIGSFQAISGKIADMKTNLELSRLAVQKAAWLIDRGDSATLAAAICKLFASESCKSACLDAVQIHGGAGYMRESGVERELRDSIAGTIYSGTSEIQRLIIARLCGI